jgi:ammonia channel protein AmtB
MSITAQLGKQAFAAAAVALYTAAATWGVLKVCDAVCGGLRVSETEEALGLDKTSHDEECYVGPQLTPAALGLQA